jgi:endonuclease/exonuclease/phosphatase (EEP) superfamily protein YafD
LLMPSAPAFAGGGYRLESARVLRDLHASDHDPLAVALQV